jgi:hypothetical protein
MLFVKYIKEERGEERESESERDVTSCIFGVYCTITYASIYREDISDNHETLN